MTTDSDPSTSSALPLLPHGETIPEDLPGAIREVKAALPTRIEASGRTMPEVFAVIEAYDPWDAAYRTEAEQYPGTTMCSAFRTFQRWTALPDMTNDQGVLFTVPVPHAMAYLMLRPLMPDVPDDDMCGVTTNQVFPANDRWHPLLMRAESGIPDVHPGDSVWWHCDMIHGVEPVADQQGWGNVMYIPAAPWCRKNEDYSDLVRKAFRGGESPFDFPEENYEVDWHNRFREDELNDIGRRGMGLSEE